MASSSPRHRLDLTFSYDSEFEAQTIERSLAREVGEIDDERSRTSIDRTGADVSLAIEAEDYVALRAATNTWCALADVAERSVDLGERYATSWALD